MSLRHDDDLPPLTPDQQAAAIRLAARLQEEETTRQDLLRAAEEAGIDPRFMREAARRVAAGPTIRTFPKSPVDTLDWCGLGLFVLGFVAIPTALFSHDRALLGHGLWLPLAFAVLLCAVLAGFWMRRKGSFALLLATQLISWLILDLVLDIEFGGPPCLVAYLPVLAVEAMLSFVGMSLAWSVKALLDARNTRVGHNPRA